MKKLMLSVAMLMLIASQGFSAEEAGIPSIGAPVDHQSTLPAIPADLGRPQYGVTPQGENVQDVINKAVQAINACKEERDARRQEVIGR